MTRFDADNPGTDLDAILLTSSEANGSVGLSIRHYKSFPAINVKEIEEAAEGLTARSVSEGQPMKFTMDIFEVEPGGHSAYHGHPWEHEIFVIKGDGLLKIGEREMRFHEGDIIYIAPNELHQIRNDGDSLVEFVCVIPRALVGIHYKEKMPHRFAATAEMASGRFEFEDKNSGQVFTYLVDEFVADHMHKGIFVDRAGWRSLPQILKSCKIPWSSLYGREGRTGTALAELQRRALIEKSIFPGERGRGGKVLRVRVAYGKDLVRRHVEDRVKKMV